MAVESLTYCKLDPFNGYSNGNLILGLYFAVGVVQVIPYRQKILNQHDSKSIINS
jgi:hypothetical protein